MSAWYNEIDREKAAWLRELIKARVIADGEVDERDIRQVEASDLRRFRQCHFFAGIGVWSYALRLAGWPDDRPVWTGSCPCPSFSCAGKGEGFDDPRHLWPAWFGRIEECQPATIFGEQSDDAIGYGWLDLVQADLESAAYSVGKAVLGACSVGAPHIRQRLYFCADAASSRRQETRQHNGRQPLLSARSVEHSGAVSGSDTERDGRRANVAQWEPQGRIVDGRDSSVGVSSHAESGRLQQHDAGERTVRQLSEGCATSERTGWLSPEQARSVAATGATRGFWRDCDWWHARDEKYRPIGPGLFPLAHGVANRVLKLRGYGDAIVAEVAQAFIEAYLDMEKVA